MFQVLTSMPGPDRKIDFLGCPLEDVVFGGGLLAGNCGKLYGST